MVLCCCCSQSSFEDHGLDEHLETEERVGRTGHLGDHTDDGGVGTSSLGEVAVGRGIELVADGERIILIDIHLDGGKLLGDGNLVGGHGRAVVEGVAECVVHEQTDCLVGRSAIGRIHGVVLGVAHLDGSHRATEHADWVDLDIGDDVGVHLVGVHESLVLLGEAGLVQLIEAVECSTVFENKRHSFLLLFCLLLVILSFSLANVWVRPLVPNTSEVIGVLGGNTHEGGLSSKSLQTSLL